MVDIDTFFGVLDGFAAPLGVAQDHAYRREVLTRQTARRREARKRSPFRSRGHEAVSKDASPPAWT
jgi:hypothetical protein